MKPMIWLLMKPMIWLLIPILFLNYLCQTYAYVFFPMESPGRAPNYSYSDSWTSEELWPKERSIIHVQLVSPSPKEIPAWELRSKDSYLSDPSLDFDAAFKTHSQNDCLFEYKTNDNDNLLIVQISGPKCVTIPFNSLHSHDNLTHLVIRNTGLVNLTKFIFGAAKLDKLTRVDIIENGQLCSINERAFDGLTRLTYLSFINNVNMSDINSEIFVGLKNLVELIWVNNGNMRRDILSTLLESSSVRILPNLIHLHLSGQNYRQSNDYHNWESDSDTHLLNSGLKLYKDDFKSLTQLKYFQLTNCDIIIIDPMVLLPLRRNLIGLNLSNNRRLNRNSLKLAIINAFQLNSSQLAIERLDISGILAFKSIPKDLLSVISKTKVTELYLNYLPLRQIMIGDIPPMPLLKTLHMEYTQLEYIEESAFITLEELTKLSLKGNFLKTIQVTFVSDMPKLEYLDLSGYKHNKTAFEVPHKAFIGTNLKELDLSYKILDPLKRKAFLGLFKTQRFHLRGCGLKLVEYLTFFPLKSLIYIDLSENHEMITTLRETQEDSLFGLEAVQMLRMAQCNLTSHDINDTEGIFKRIHEHVQLLDLSYNNIDQITVNTFKNFTDLQHLDLSHNNIRPWVNFSIFQHNADIMTLDISNNELNHVTSSMLEDFHRLKNLSFAKNPLICECQSQIIVDWLNENSEIHYLHNRHPLNSKSQYHCITNDNKKISLREFIVYCKTAHLKTTHVSLAVLSGITLTLLFFTLIILILVYVYYSTLRSLFISIDDDNHNYQYDAFVSYNVNDSDWVFKQLVPNIENNDSDANHIKLCVYDRDFIAGRPISECILESIKMSRKVILVISKNFVRSPWCRFETDLAHNTLMDENRDGLIMIKLEELDSEIIAPQLHFLLKTRIYLQWNDKSHKEQEIFWKKLRRSLGFNDYKKKYYGRNEISFSIPMKLGKNYLSKKSNIDSCVYKNKMVENDGISIIRECKDESRKECPIVASIAT